eukprot:CAMPEP_0198138870 /NCGR_PEP_ID=MMETSP1443-20131203/2251_1 /TAXON_ID=186043 /ORGANISM="Entomoneis sp., Strain CCMP2396" /LENGTH=175 /DNA_ID=CAMNT_0043800817 /DNA_START=11 /DNA_END=538 /DNA_ORIENTATION=-
MKTSFLAIIVCLLVTPSTLAGDSEDQLVTSPRSANPRRVLKKGKSKNEGASFSSMVIYGPGLDFSVGYGQALAFLLPSPGDSIFSDQDLTDEVGVSVFLCSPAGSLLAICSTTLSFHVDEEEQPELLTFQGIAYTTEDGAPHSAAITGGTGRFSGATGLVKATHLDVVTFNIYFD